MDSHVGSATPHGDASYTEYTDAHPVRLRSSFIRRLIRALFWTVGVAAGVVALWFTAAMFTSASARRYRRAEAGCRQ